MQPHPSFVDMSGAEIGQLKVIRRAENWKNIARWVCRCKCGREVVMLGISLRRSQNKGRSPCCPVCRPKRPPPQRRRRREQPARRKLTSHFCPVCFGQPHRVRGKECRSCHLPRADRPALERLHQLLR